MVIPGIANTFLALVKDTPLIFVVGLTELRNACFSKNKSKMVRFCNGRIYLCIDNILDYMLCNDKYSYNLEANIKLKDNISDQIIKIQNMNKWFGDFQVLKNINLEVEANKKIVVCGPSGSTNQH